VLILVTGAIQPLCLHAAATLVLTENSSSSLTATLNGTGLTVVQFSPDLWQITPPATDDFLMADLFWSEPNTTFSVNVALLGVGGFNLIDVISEGIPPVGMPIYTNGTPVTVTNGIVISGVQQDLNVTFNDNGDIATTPEPATLWFVLAALVPVAAFRRKFRTL
jgi:hypothetical protein